MTKADDSPDSPSRYGDSVDLHDPAFDVLTPTSDIITVDPQHSFSSDASDHVGGFNSLTESGKPKMHHRETKDDFSQSVSSAGLQSMASSGISAFYARDTENDVSGDSDNEDEDEDVDIDDMDSQESIKLDDNVPPASDNQWTQATDSMPRLISETYTNIDDLDDSDPEDDDEMDNYSDDGSEGSYASARTIDTSFSGFSDAPAGERMDSELFSDDGHDFDDRDSSLSDASYQDNTNSSRGNDSSFIRPASDLSSGDEFHDSSDDDDDDDDGFSDLR